MTNKEAIEHLKKDMSWVLDEGCMIRPVVKIDGAMIMPDVEKVEINGEEGWRFPSFNTEYTIFTLYDVGFLTGFAGAPMNDGKSKLGMALSVIYKGVRYVTPDFIKLIKEALISEINERFRTSEDFMNDVEKLEGVFE